VRLRQILLNLMTNAVKYTERGHIGLSITQEKRKDSATASKVWLKITVSDTGYGIKPEDQKRLFGDFVQVDTKKNHAIEGTGLGLPIAKRLCKAMGGNIAVTSKYGEGSSFTATIPQGIDSPVPFAKVEEPERKKVLLYERRVACNQSVCWSLENMKVPYALVSDYDAFAEALFREEWFFVFSGYGLYGKIKPMMDRPDEDFPGGKKPSLALMVDWGIETYIPNVRFVSMPIQSLSIANVLNDQADRRNYFENSNKIQFVCPGARILVVDDISTNLKVAQGLLSPYKAIVDTCLGGNEAIELIKRWDYDIVFMDHMMPEMDGIETTAIIRAWEEERRQGGEVYFDIPIIALTANAVSGMKELFIEQGFSDFLAKPVDVSKLDETLGRWIPETKKEGGGRSEDDAALGSSFEASPLVIPGIDTAAGIAGTGGTLAGYRQVLSMFGKDAADRLPLLQAMPRTETLPAFITQVHALKSAAASIGAESLSEKAARLEAAGKEKDLAFIGKNLKPFAKQLAELVKDIGVALGLPGAWGNPPANVGAKTSGGVSAHIPVLRELSAALKSQNVSEIDRLMDGLARQSPDSKMRETLERLSDEVLMAEFDAAIDTIDELIAKAG